MTVEGARRKPHGAGGGCQFIIGDLDGAEDDPSEDGPTGLMEECRGTRGGSEESARSCESGYSALGTNVGDLRPRSLAIPSLDRCSGGRGPRNSDYFAGSLPTQPSSMILPRKRQPPLPPRDLTPSIPRIKCSQAVASAPSTPLGVADIWPGDTASICSVDEAEEATDAQLMYLLSPDGESPNGGKKRSKSRLSLNLAGGRDDLLIDRTPSPTAARSPSLIPKFLRNSFSRLMNRDPKKSEVDSSNAACDGSQSNATTPTPSSSVKKCSTARELIYQDLPPSPSISCSSGPHHASTVPSLCMYGNNNDPRSRSSSTSCCSEVATTEGAVPMSPDTLEYLEETNLNSLPVIPFTFPTAVIAEKLKNKNRQQKRNPSGGSSCTGSTSSPKTIKRSNEAASDLDYHYRDHLEFAPSSLEEIVFDAEQELRFESEQGRRRDFHHRAEERLRPSRSNVWRVGGDHEEDDDRLSQYTVGLDDDAADDSCSAAETAALAQRRRLEDDGYFEMFTAEPVAPASAASVATELANFQVGVGRT